MDHDESLWALFNISKWICNNQILDYEKLILLKPAMEIIQHLLKLTGIETMQKICADTEGLYLVMSYILYLNDKDLVALLASIISYMKEPTLIINGISKMIKVEAEATKNNLYDAQENLAICLQNKIFSLIQLANVPSKTPLDTKYSDLHIWSEHLALVL